MSHALLFVAGASLCVLLVQGLVLRRLARVARDLAAYEEKRGHLSDALSLLTETTESSFRAVATELERLVAGGQATAAPRTTTRRVRAAAGRGRSVAEIAAAEQVAEGEVRLRLHLAEDAPASGTRARRPRGAERTGEPVVA